MILRALSTKSDLSAMMISEEYKSMKWFQILQKKTLCYTADYGHKSQLPKHKWENLCGICPYIYSEENWKPKQKLQCMSTNFEFNVSSVY